jgi:hypothetical protein
MHATLTPVEKTEMNDKALSVIILCLGDKVLREVARETTAVAMWIKRGSLYMSKQWRSQKFSIDGALKKCLQYKGQFGMTFLGFKNYLEAKSKNKSI